MIGRLSRDFGGCEDASPAEASELRPAPEVAQVARTHKEARFFSGGRSLLLTRSLKRDLQLQESL